MCQKKIIEKFNFYKILTKRFRFHNLKKLRDYFFKGICVFLSFSILHGVDYFWVPSGGGSWGDPNNWDPPGVPSLADRAEISVLFSGDYDLSVNNNSISFLLFQNASGPGRQFHLSGGNFTFANGGGLSFEGNNFSGACGISANLVEDGNTMFISLSGADGSGGNTFTINGTISGIGGIIEKNGSSPLFITGNNTYTGGTVITDGFIVLSGSGTIGTGAPLTVNNNGGIIFLTDLGSRAVGSLSGTGGTINLNNNTLTVTQTTGATFAGVVTGTSSANIVKEGAATLTLTGASTGFLGDTTINAGGLVVNGTLNGETTMNAGTRLSGTGTLNNLRNLGTVAPGNSIGTLTITGDYTVADPAAILEIEIDPNGTADKLAITGTADLDGYVHLLPNPGSYVKGTQFLILTAGSITDNFLGIVESDPLDFSLLKVGNSIYIVVETGTVIINPFVNLLTGNPKLTYNYLFCTSSGDEALVALQNILLALPTLQAFSDALVQLCPALYSSLPLLELQNNVHMAQVMNQKNRKYFCDCHDNDQNRYVKKEPWSYWMQPIGFYYNQKGVQNQYGFHNYTYGAAFGFLLPLPSGVLLDLGLGYTHSDLKWNNDRGTARSNTIYFAPSFSLWFKPFCLSLIVQGDVDLYSVRRNIEFTGVNETSKSSFESYNFLCGIDFSAKLEIPDPYFSNAPFYIEPEMQFYCMNFFQNRFVEEDGGDLNLSVGHKYTLFLQPNLGFKVTQEFQTQTVCFAPNIYIGYLANIPLNNSNYNSNMPGFNIPCASNFTVYGYHRITNQLALAAEFVVKECDNMLFSLGYNATMFSHIFTQGVNLRLSLEF